MSGYELWIIVGGISVNLLVAFLAYLKSANNSHRLEILTYQTNGISAALAERNAILLQITADSEYAKGLLAGKKVKEILERTKP